MKNLKFLKLGANITAIAFSVVLAGSLVPEVRGYVDNLVYKKMEETVFNKIEDHRYKILKDEFLNNMDWEDAQLNKFDLFMSVDKINEFKNTLADKSVFEENLKKIRDLAETKEERKKFKEEIQKDSHYQKMMKEFEEAEKQVKSKVMVIDLISGRMSVEEKENSSKSKNKPG